MESSEQRQVKDMDRILAEVCSEMHQTRKELWYDLKLAKNCCKRYFALEP